MELARYEKMNNDLLVKVCQILHTDQVYMVGGCVRDELLKRTPKDYDFATPLQPDNIEALAVLHQHKTYGVGKRFGTIGIKLDGQIVEVTTFRSEVYEKGNRKPTVEYVNDISADLSRRDFTINAIAYRITENGEARWIDPYHGREDLDLALIRFVGNPTTRIKEDPLRILRAIRFASQLGFTIEAQSFKKIKEHSHKILEVSKERWVQELDKLLQGEHVGKGLFYLAESGLLRYMLPELQLQVGYNQQSPYHSFDLWTHTAIVVKLSPNNLDTRWAALLHDVAKPFVAQKKKNSEQSIYAMHEIVGAEMVEKIARYLKWGNERRENVKELVRHHLEETSPLKQADDLAKGDYCG